MRFEVLLDEPFIAPWQCRCVEQLGAVATLTAIRTARSVSGAPRSSAGARRVGAADLLGRSIDAGTHFAPVACSAEPRPGDGSEPHDFAIAFGRFTPEAATGRWPHFGVWRFQHDVAGNALPFFEETESGADVTYAALVAIVGSGSPVLLEQGWFRTEKLSYRRQLEHLLTRISEWPARVCGRLAQNPSGFPAAVAPNPAPAPGRPRVLRYRTRVLARRARLAFERAFRHQQWNVGLLNARPDELVRPGGYDDRRIEWFPLSTRDRFLADPFGVEREGALHVFCEEYPYRVGRGHIARLAWPGSELRHERALELAVHMSYPFLIDEGERTYCVPETSQANEVALYRVRRFSEPVAEGGRAASGLRRSRFDDIPTCRPVVAHVHQTRARRRCRALDLACADPHRSVDATRAEPGEDRRARRTARGRALPPRGRALSAGSGLLEALRLAHRHPARDAR